MKDQPGRERAVFGVAFILCTLKFQLVTAFAQGSLAPPGPPAPTMKTLQQTEPRTAITNAGAVVISQPGSYYLTTNITVGSGDAITINANGVTLDLNGFNHSRGETTSWTGIACSVAVDCDGLASNGLGLSALVAIGCRGDANLLLGQSMNVQIANCCIGSPAVIASYTYNMP